jgi:hypothetical protein
VSPRTIHDPDLYLLGVADGRKDVAATAVARLIAAELRQRECDESLKQLERENRRLRYALRADRWNAVGWSAISAALTFLATWNFAVNGWSW